MVTPLVEWQAEMERRGRLDCGFVCPVCRNVATANDFMALGVAPDRAATECIGRVRPAVIVHGEDNTAANGGCDWTAYGLIQGPDFVALPSGGRLPVFAFAGAGS